MKVAIKLFIITTICGALLWGVNSLTAPIIQNNKDAAKTEAYKEIVEFDDFEIKELEGTIQEMFTAKKGGKTVGYVFLGDKTNNFGNITAMVLIDPEGNIQKVNINTYNQTAGKDTVTGEAFLGQFVGSMDNVENVDTKVGATFAATTVKDIAVAATNKFKAEVLGEEIIEKQDAPKADFAKAANGTYVGEYQGFAGLIKVQVIVKDGVATSVKVLEHAESIPGACQTIPEAIVKANSVDVDTVSGNTVSSQAIIQAVNEAMLNKVSDSTEVEVEKEPEVVEAPKADFTKAANGTYEGEAQGFAGKIKVQVIVKDGVATSVKVLEHTESVPGACTTIPEAIVKANSVDVDTVSGNTVSSQAIIKAVNEAMLNKVSDETGAEPEKEDKPVEPTEETVEKLDIADGTYTGEAKGFVGAVKVSVTVKDGILTEVKVTENSESINGACQTIPEAMMKQNKIDVDTVSGNTVTSKAIIEAVNAAVAPKEESSSLTDGTYEGTAKGFQNDIKVSVTVEGGKISKVEVLEANDTAGISDNAINNMPGKFVGRTDANVDVVSGASFTSNGIINAVKAALGL